MIERKKYTQKELAYRDIPENPIILDFSKCDSWYDIHKMLGYKFGLPVATGTNWSAFWDFARDTFDGREENYFIEIHNFYSMSKEYQDYCKPMINIFERIQKENSNVFFAYIS
jgi:RNAse (barnase) inhibitor barstar